MPKKTFFNLNNKKKTEIYDVLVKLFKEKSFKDVTVQEIVEKLNISRGSFYQYFDSLNEAYFYILEQELIEIHESFLILARKYNKNIFDALDLFGEVIANELFKDKCYSLYRSRYLYHDAKLEKEWKLYRTKNNSDENMVFFANKEKTAFISSIIHSLIERNFVESWNKEVFIEHYKMHINWIKRGIEK